MRALLSSTGNSKYSMITYMGKEFENIYLNHFVVQQKLTQQCKSTSIEP